MSTISSCFWRVDDGLVLCPWGLSSCHNTHMIWTSSQSSFIWYCGPYAPFCHESLWLDRGLSRRTISRQCTSVFFLSTFVLPVVSAGDNVQPLNQKSLAVMAARTAMAVTRAMVMVAMMTVMAAVMAMETFTLKLPCSSSSFCLLQFVGPHGSGEQEASRSWCGSTWKWRYGWSEGEWITPAINRFDSNSHSNSMSKIQVKGLAAATCTQRVLTTLEELNVPYELIPGKKPSSTLWLW